MKLRILFSLLPILLTACQPEPMYQDFAAGNPNAAAIKVVRVPNKQNPAANFSSVLMRVDSKNIENDPIAKYILVSPGKHQLEVNFMQLKVLLYACQTKLTAEFKPKTHYEIEGKLKDSQMTVWVEDEKHNIVSVQSNCELRHPMPRMDVIMFNMLNHSIIQRSLS